MVKNYQALIEDKIFFGGAADVEDMFYNEGIEVVVDLRGEASEPALANEKLQWVQVPLEDHATGPQDELYREAIDNVLKAYHSGKKVGFHCGGGRGRTGTVAIGTLIELGISKDLQEAEVLAKTIRPSINIKSSHRQSLEKMY
ncbi:protein tyrosine phosphatase [Paenibacillus yonginensis]|uniref:Protein tyrosine phosphatase n=2 Tax=Paenibacillus TaxID=44249 RepID=A0A1B1N5Y3_9BACL|nr:MULTISPECIES: dual specificity protein phosphatase family protein [Paenibacillus]ANS76850.1 protein tyrosine phosphatase [Paenibacillus yonginensis]GGA31973.1 hypothetical protein GCM10010917_16390 [Paenibacillus physcomitrellae]